MSHIPRFDAIDYSHPERYLELDPSFVGGDVVAETASRFRGAGAETSLRNIWRWLRDNLASEHQQSDYRWRTASEIISRGRYFGCAEHALVYGCMARACGIPSVWVKSLDIPWIRRFRATREFDGGSGHVYLEIFLAGAWSLLDATQDELFEAYDPSQRLLPGHDVDRYAYDKGGNARELVLSLDWEPWKRETQEFFGDFNLQLLDDAACAVTGPGRRLAV